MLRWMEKEGRRGGCLLIEYEEEGEEKEGGRVKSSRLTGSPQRRKLCTSNSRKTTVDAWSHRPHSI